MRFGVLSWPVEGHYTMYLAPQTCHGNHIERGHKADPQTWYGSRIGSGSASMDLLQKSVYVLRSCASCCFEYVGIYFMFCRDYQIRLVLEQSWFRISSMISFMCRKRCCKNLTWCLCNVGLPDNATSGGSIAEKFTCLNTQPCSCMYASTCLLIGRECCKRGLAADASIM